MKVNCKLRKRPPVPEVYKNVGLDSVYNLMSRLNIDDFTIEMRKNVLFELGNDLYRWDKGEYFVIWDTSPLTCEKLTDDEFHILFRQ